jgi:hypothetical protein
MHSVVDVSVQQDHAGSVSQEACMIAEHAFVALRTMDRSCLALMLEHGPRLGVSSVIPSRRIEPIDIEMDAHALHL